MARYLYSELATAIDALARCKATTANTSQAAHADIWEDQIESLVKQHMPSGSGYDSGTKIDLDASHADKLVFHTGFHHMNENGYYAGWTEHTITVKPSLQSEFTLRISGRNRNNIKEMMYEDVRNALHQDVEYDVIEPMRTRLGVELKTRWIDQSRLVYDVAGPDTPVKTFASDDPSVTYNGSPLERARAYAVKLTWELFRKEGTRA